MQADIAFRAQAHPLEHPLGMAARLGSAEQTVQLAGEEGARGQDEAQIDHHQQQAGGQPPHGQQQADAERLEIHRLGQGMLAEGQAETVGQLVDQVLALARGLGQTLAELGRRVIDQGAGRGQQREDEHEGRADTDPFGGLGYDAAHLIGQDVDQQQGEHRHDQGGHHVLQPVGGGEDGQHRENQRAVGQCRATGAPAIGVRFAGRTGGHRISLIP